MAILKERKYYRGFPYTVVKYQNKQKHQQNFHICPKSWLDFFIGIFWLRSWNRHLIYTLSRDLSLHDWSVHTCSAGTMLLWQWHQWRSHSHQNRLVIAGGIPCTLVQDYKSSRIYKSQSRWCLEWVHLDWGSLSVSFIPLLTDATSRSVCSWLELQLPAQWVTFCSWGVSDHQSSFTGSTVGVSTHEPAAIWGLCLSSELCLRGGDE